MPGPLLLAGLAAGAGILSGVVGNRARTGESKQNRRFQERMRNTQWQAGVEDMRAAGLNPALAYQQGGAASPSGSMAQVENVGEESVSNAMAVKVQQEQLKLLTEQRKKTTLEGIKVGYEGTQSMYQERLARESYNFYFDLNGKPKQPLKEMVAAEHGAKMGSSARQVSEAQLSQLSIPEREAIAKLFEQMGSEGAGIQRFLPLIIQLLGRR